MCGGAAGLGPCILEEDFQKERIKLFELGTHVGQEVHRDSWFVCRYCFESDKERLFNSLINGWPVQTNTESDTNVI